MPNVALQSAIQNPLIFNSGDQHVKMVYSVKCLGFPVIVGPQTK